MSLGHLISVLMWAQIWSANPYMAEDDLDSVLSIYDPEAVFLNQSGEVPQWRLGICGGGMITSGTSPGPAEDQFGHQGRPAGLVARAQARAVLPVEILMERDVVAPVRVGL